MNIDFWNYILFFRYQLEWTWYLLPSFWWNGAVSFKNDWRTSSALLMPSLISSNRWCCWRHSRFKVSLLWNASTSSGHASPFVSLMVLSNTITSFSTISYACFPRPRDRWRGIYDPDSMTGPYAWFWLTVMTSVCFSFDWTSINKIFVIRWHWFKGARRKQFQVIAIGGTIQNPGCVWLMPLKIFDCGMTVVAKVRAIWTC